MRRSLASSKNGRDRRVTKLECRVYAEVSSRIWNILIRASLSLMETSARADALLPEFRERPSDNTFIQIRAFGAGPGRGHKSPGVGGWPVTEELTFKEALESEEFREVAGEMRDRLIYVFKDLVSSGVIKIEEVTA